MAKINVLPGMVFERLTVIGSAERDARGNVRSMCRCECGTVKPVVNDRLARGISRSCGCLHRDELVARLKKHGGTKTPGYKSWRAAIRRCTNPNDRVYPYYGARGITVCDRWMDFTKFIEDMGEAPKGMTLERKDVNKGYEPGNCIWADWTTQSRNRRGLRKYLVDGEWRGAAELSALWKLSERAAKKKAQEYPTKTIGEQE